jgi:hypothetical protein
LRSPRPILGGVIVYERDVWEAEKRFYFRARHGATPICGVTRLNVISSFFGHEVTRLDDE